MVVSDSNTDLYDHADGLASYYDTLLDGAFGNFRDLLKAVTLTPAMGQFLNMLGSQKGSLAAGRHPSENYGREIMQLFSIGLNRLWPDGTDALDSQGNLIPTYDQSAITGGMARVFTGWNFNQPLQSSGRLPTNFYPPSNWTGPMVLVPLYHELGAKTVLDHVVLPGASGYTEGQTPVAGSQADSSTAAFDTYCSQDLEKALDNIFYHPNVGPFICRQLIQRLVESNPSSAYIGRVSAVFDDDSSSSHLRGNLQAVIKAILLDGEARNVLAASATAFSGKQREPLLRVTGPARTFLATAINGSYSQQGSQIITITTKSGHKLGPNDQVRLDFKVNDTGTPPAAPWYNPSSQGYTVLSSPAPTATTFAVNAASLASLTYSQPAGSNLMTLAVSNGTPPAGASVYLDFLASGPANGTYAVASQTDASHFTVVTQDTPAAARSGSACMPVSTGGYYDITKAGSTSAVTFEIISGSNTNLRVGDHVYFVDPAGRIDAGEPRRTRRCIYTGRTAFHGYNHGVTDTREPRKCHALPSHCSAAYQERIGCHSWWRI